MLIVNFNYLKISENYHVVLVKYFTTKQRMNLFSYLVNWRSVLLVLRKKEKKLHEFIFLADVTRRLLTWRHMPECWDFFRWCLIGADTAVECEPHVCPDHSKSYVWGLAAAHSRSIDCRARYIHSLSMSVDLHGSMANVHWQMSIACVSIYELVLQMHCYCTESPVRQIENNCAQALCALVIRPAV